MTAKTARLRWRIHKAVKNFLQKAKKGVDILRSFKYNAHVVSVLV